MNRLMIAAGLAAVAGCAMFAPKTYDGVDLAPGDIDAADLTPVRVVGSASGDPVVIVKDGKARLPIVYVDKNGEWAAKQLQATIGEMTGVKPTVVVEGKFKEPSGTQAFYIGATKAAEAAGLKAPTDHPEAFRVVTKGGSFFFLGKAAFAVTDWCERQLDARYYWAVQPNQTYGEKWKKPLYGKCVRKTHGLAARPVDWTDWPEFGFRDNWPYEWCDWNRWGKGGISHRGGQNVHAPHGWWKEKDALDHVEIFALSEDGKRPNSGLLCYGNPKTLAYYEFRTRQGIEAYGKHLAEVEAAPAAEKGKLKFKDPSGGILNYKQKIVTISQWDCGVTCACEYCKKLFNEDLGTSGSGSPIIWGYFTKNYAKWLKDNYPDWKICILPYINTCDVPPDPENPERKLDLTAEGNVEAQLCTMPGLAMLKNESCKRHEEDLIREWAKCTGKPVLNWHYSCWPSEFTSAPYVYGETVRRHYADMRGVISGSFINGTFDGRRSSLSVYVWMRCLWNPELDVQAVYDEFAKRMFGAAARPMRKLIRMQEEGWNRQWGANMCSAKNIHGISYPRAEVVEMQGLLEQARTLAQGDEKAQARLAWYAAGFEKFFKESEETASGTAFAPFHMKKAVVPPVVDGKLDDSCWKEGTPNAFVHAMNRTNSVPKYATALQAVWVPDKGVILGLRCTEPATAVMKQGVAGDNWGQDNVEIFIDATGGGDGHFYQLIVDATGRFVAYTDGPDWRAQGVVAKTDIGDGFWTMEVFLPFATFKNFVGAQIPTTSANGCVWAGNVIRWRVGDCALPKDKRAPGSKNEMSRLNTRYNGWNKDASAFSTWTFVE